MWLNKKIFFSNINIANRRYGRRPFQLSRHIVVFDEIDFLKKSPPVILIGYIEIPTLHPKMAGQPVHRCKFRSTRRYCRTLPRDNVSIPIPVGMPTKFRSISYTS